MTGSPNSRLKGFPTKLFRGPGCWLGSLQERTNMRGLFDPLELGALALPNRIVMAPLTRARAGREGVPNALLGQYYAQRASAGLIISEAIGISREGLGWPNAPGLWCNAQVEGWRIVTDAV